ncbi:hypothetical protein METBISCDRAFT_21389 [Metschnikowia bicuspidata]|uniref:Uncharacterized protein n=1 Tax=Metschnikowia bicuspidata TaxID=27322 RepID=A0A4P9ZJ56_9ASCO|nr:hypothetical protein METBISCDRAFT_21389 [Metschnikowia bicuspidata]
MQVPEDQEPPSPASSIGISSDNEFEQLLEHQTRKSELVKKRDFLAKKRLQLKEECENLGAQLGSLQEQKRQQETRKKLEFYLHQNEHEFTRLSAPENSANFVLEILRVLPSADCPLRRRYMRRLHPHFRIDAYSSVQGATANSHSINFTIAAADVPPFAVKVAVCDQTVENLTIVNWDDIAPTLQSVCPAYRQCVKDVYLFRCQLDLLVCSYQSLSNVQHEKVAVFRDILAKYASYVSYPTSSGNAVAAASFLVLPYVQLTIEHHKTPLLVRLSWKIVLRQQHLGVLDSKIDFSLLTHTHEPLPHAPDVFATLRESFGVVQAFSLMLYNVFNIE